MNERRALAVAGASAALLTAAGFLLLAAGSPAASSTLSRDSRGWLAARRYLEVMGTQVTLLDQDLEVPRGGGVLVLAFPWQEAGGADVPAANVVQISVIRFGHHGVDGANAPISRQSQHVIEKRVGHSRWR